MELEVLRYSSQEDSTIGALFDHTDGTKFLCYTLEDEYRENKVMHETRIPAGTYEITLRTWGGFHERYSKRFPEIHQGMLWIRNVPNFEYILIHCGNDDDDTSGCLLVGDTQTSNANGSDGFVGNSIRAYKKIYPYILKAIVDKEKVTITYTDFDSV
jgi:hypothetical protein